MGGIKDMISPPIHPGLGPPFTIPPLINHHSPACHPPPPPPLTFLPKTIDDGGGGGVYISRRRGFLRERFVEEGGSGVARGGTARRGAPNPAKNFKKFI